MGITDFISTPKGKLATALIAVLFVVMLYEMKDFAGSLWPSEAQVESQKKTLKKLHEQYREALTLEREIDAKRGRFLARSKDFWLDARDGDPKVKAMATLEAAANNSDLELNSNWNPKPSQVADGVFAYEIRIDTTATMENISGFLAAIYQQSPLFYWQGISLRPENLRDPEKVRFSGRLRFLNITNEKLAKFLTEEPDVPAAAAPAPQAAKGSAETPPSQPRRPAKGGAFQPRGQRPGGPGVSADAGGAPGVGGDPQRPGPGPSFPHRGQRPGGPPPANAPPGQARP